MKRNFGQFFFTKMLKMFDTLSIESVSLKNFLHEKFLYQESKLAPKSLNYLINWIINDFVSNH